MWQNCELFGEQRFSLRGSARNRPELWQRNCFGRWQRKVRRSTPHSRLVTSSLTQADRSQPHCRRLGCLTEAGEEKNLTRKPVCITRVYSELSTEILARLPMSLNFLVNSLGTGRRCGLMKLSVSNCYPYSCSWLIVRLQTPTDFTHKFFLTIESGRTGIDCFNKDAFIHNFCG